jgi:hypothetical protein
MQITVTGNIGTFKGGQVLTTDKDIVRYHRVMVNEGADKPTTMSDDAILAAVKSVEGDSEDAEMARVALLETGGAVSVSAVNMSSLTGVPAEAAKLAAIAAKDASLMSHVHELSEANVMQKRKGLTVALSLGEAYTADELAQFPIPGTETGNNPDRYTVEGKNAKGVKTNKKRSFYRDFAEFTPEGAELKAKLQSIRDDASLGDKEKETRAAGLETRLDYLASVYASAVAFIVQLETINTMFADKVEAVIQEGDDGEGSYSNSTKPMLVIDLIKKGESKVMSVGAFLALKPKAAEGKGFKELIATSSRKGKGDHTATDTKIPSADKATDVILALVNFFDDKDSYAKLAKAVAKEGGDQLIEALGDLNIATDDFMPTIQSRYDAIKMARAKKAQADKAEAKAAV